MDRGSKGEKERERKYDRRIYMRPRRGLCVMKKRLLVKQRRYGSVVARNYDGAQSGKSPVAESYHCCYSNDRDQVGPALVEYSEA